MSSLESLEENTEYENEHDFRTCPYFSKHVEQIEVENRLNEQIIKLTENIKMLATDNLSLNRKNENLKAMLGEELVKFNSVCRMNYMLVGLNLVLVGVGFVYFYF